MTSIDDIEAAAANPQPEAVRPSRKPLLEQIAIGLMVLGGAMMFQPFALVLFTYSFIVFLVGTLMFIVVSHLPE